MKRRGCNRSLLAVAFDYAHYVFDEVFGGCDYGLAA
jgi:hypothetical protein